MKKLLCLFFFIILCNRTILNLRQHQNVAMVNGPVVKVVFKKALYVVNRTPTIFSGKRLL